MKRTLFLAMCLMAATVVKAQISNVTDVNPGPNDSTPYWLTVFNNKLYFFTASSPDGAQLRQCTSTDQISIVANANAGNIKHPDPFLLHSMTELGSKLYYLQNVINTNDHQLCSWDENRKPRFIGRPEDTKETWCMTTLGNRLYFLKNNIGYRSLHEYDPANEKFGNLNSGYYQELTTYNNKLYISESGVKTAGLWEHDPIGHTGGRISGSTYIFGTPTNLRVLNDILYFTALTVATRRFDLYAYSGSGTPANVTAPYGLNVMNAAYNCIGFYRGDLYFPAKDSTANNTHLYKYSNPGLIAELHSFPYNSIGNFTVCQDKLYFTANDSLHGSELWLYDAVHPPQMVADLYPGTTGSRPENLTVFNGTLYFTAAQPDKGVELYRLAGGRRIVEHAEIAAKTNLYPNPTTDRATLTVILGKGENVSVIVSNMAGVEVYRLTQQVQPGSNYLTLDLSKLAPGNYSYHLTGDDSKVYASGKLTKM